MAQPSTFPEYYGKGLGCGRLPRPLEAPGPLDLDMVRLPWDFDILYPLSTVRRVGEPQPRSNSKTRQHVGRNNEHDNLNLPIIKVMCTDNGWVGVPALLVRSIR